MAEQQHREAPLIISPRPCRTCGASFEITPKALARHRYICRVCVKEVNRLKLEKRRSEGKSVSGAPASPEYHKAYGIIYCARPEVKERHRINAAERRKDAVEAVKYRARVLTRNAIRRGDLTPQPCEACGALKVDAHHEDYSQPLNVRWLCRTHHRRHHQAKATAV